MKNPLREEIEKLIAPRPGYYYGTAIADVLAILDRYEVVAEYRFKKEGLIDICDGGQEVPGMPELNEAWSVIDVITTEPGDHIIIMREEATDEGK